MSSRASAGSPIATTRWAGSARRTSSTISKTRTATGSDHRWGIDSHRLSGRHEIAIKRSHVGAEAAEDHALETARMGFHFAHGDLGRLILRIAVHAGRDRREGDA